MHLSLQIYLIERYTKVGDTILDPMAGSGTLLVACTLGRNVILVELEEKFVKMQQQNWEKIKAQGAMLGYTKGQATILLGDARNLQGLLADKILFSPPFSEQMQDVDWIQKNHPRKYRGTYNPKKQNPSNISNLPYGSIDKIITSPPYGEAQSGAGIMKHDRTTCECPFCKTKRGTGARAYSKADVVISSPPYEGTDVSQTHQTSDKRGDPSNPNYRPSWKDKIEKGYCETKRPYADVICTSPPYESAVNQEKSGIDLAKMNGVSPNCQAKISFKYGEGNNIGNLKDENYLSEMLKVYRECFAILKDKGLMVLVTKNFIRNKKIVDLAADTIELCEQSGFVFKERLARKLTQQSFWRTIYYKKFPDVPRIDFEDVLVFEKPPKNEKLKLLEVKKWKNTMSPANF
jgi:DNA modification methylase